MQSETRDPRRARLPHARRVGAARGDLDRLAAQPRRLARQVRADPLGLHRDRPPPEPGRAGPHRGPRRHDAARAWPISSTPRASTSSAVTFFKAATDRVWLRDSGPTFVVKDERRVGNGADARRSGRLEVQRLGQVRQPPPRQPPPAPAGAAGWGCRAGCPRSRHEAGPSGRVVMEGGAIDVNGRGTLLDDRGMPAQRGPGAQPRARPRGPSSRSSPTIWASATSSGSAGASTATTPTATSTTWRGSSMPRTVVTVVEPRAGRPEPRAARRTTCGGSKRHATRTASRSASCALPMPEPVVFDGQRLPASYANFYIANGLVLVPTFNDPADRIALDTLAALFPDRQVVGIHAVDLVLGLGTLALPVAAAAGHSSAGDRMTTALVVWWAGTSK